MSMHTPRVFQFSRITFIALLAITWIGAAFAAQTAHADDPLRVFIRAGEETHGPGEHDYPSFMDHWLDVLADRGIQADGALEFPTAEQLADTDVLIMYTQGGVTDDDQAALIDDFTARGGNLVVLHSAVATHDPDWLIDTIGGAWVLGQTGWHVDELQGVYIQSEDHPITQNAANFDLPNEEVYYDMGLHDDIEVLATSFHDIRIIAPQMWAYETDTHRAFVWLAGHVHTTFEKEHGQTLLLRGIAWAAGLDADTFVTEDEVANLRYPDRGPVRPDHAHETFDLHPEFDLSLASAEPDVVNPIDMAFDGNGRLWIAQTIDYPKVRDPENPQDIITIHEDTNGDGYLDHVTTFADDLGLITSIALYKDGVIVAQAPDIFWLRDTNGDGRADARELILTGFGTFDTHAVVNHLRWGMDGWIYATLGYSRGELSNADGDNFGNFDDGVFRFLPDGSQVQEVTTEPRGGNTWGLDFTWDGEMLWSQATSGRHIFHNVMPQWALSGHRIDGAQSSTIPLDEYIPLYPPMEDNRPAYVQVAPVGGFTAAIGCTVYTGGAWPEQYNTSFFISEPTWWLTHRGVFESTGITFTAEPARHAPEKEFIAARDLWFLPAGHRIGPDGAMYINDFYNQAVSHNDIRVGGEYHGPTNAAYRPDRDRHFGRIWRIQHENADQFDAPALANADPATLIQALQHPNRWFRITAQRELIDNNHTDAADNLASLLHSDADPAGRVHALWTLEGLGQLSNESLAQTIADDDPAVRKNAARVISDRQFTGREVSPDLEPVLLARLNDDNPRAQLEAVIALGSITGNGEQTAEQLITAYPALDNVWARSASLRALSRTPEQAIVAALDSDHPGELTSLVNRLTGRAVAQNHDAAARLVQAIAAQPQDDTGLGRVVLAALADAVGDDRRPAWSDDLAHALRTLLASDNESVAAAALPLIGRWDQDGQLEGPLNERIGQFSAILRDADRPQADRVALAEGLLAARPVNVDAIEAVGEMLRAPGAASLKEQIIEALGDVDHPAVGEELIASYAALSPSLQALALDHLLRRSEWSHQLVAALADEQLTPAMLGPTGLERLRRHSDETVASAARDTLDNLRGDHQQQVDDVIAEVIALIREDGRGNPTAGQQIFQACTVCHQFRGDGSDLGPELTGMGANDTQYLLRKILDPNDSLEPTYMAYEVTTTDGRSFLGMITREDADGILLRNQATEVELSHDEIESTRATGRSLMPEGFAALGADNLRNILAYMREGEGNYRTLDLSNAFTVSTDGGMWYDLDATGDALDLQEYGTVSVEDVPFHVVRPGVTPSGNNAITLRGGDGDAQSLPQRVTIDANVQANRLHFLGGIGGWAYPFGDEEGHEVPVVEAVIHYADGETETLVMHNGRHFADWIGRHDVPESQYVEGLTDRGQLRWFSMDLERGGVIERIELSSPNNHVAPTLLAITAEMPE